MTRDDYLVLLSMLEQMYSQLEDEANQLGTDGVPDEANAVLANVEVLKTAYSIVATNAELHFPADTELSR